jgi:hypothetical protein
MRKEKRESTCFSVRVGGTLEDEMIMRTQIVLIEKHSKGFIPTEPRNVLYGVLRSVLIGKIMVFR